MRIINDEQYEAIIVNMIDYWYSKYGKYYKTDIDGSEYIATDMMTDSECRMCGDLDALIDELRVAPYCTPLKKSVSLQFTAEQYGYLMDVLTGEWDRRFGKYVNYTLDGRVLMDEMPYGEHCESVELKGLIDHIRKERGNCGR